MFNVILVKSGLNGPLHLIRADEYSISDGPILGVLDSEIFDADDLYDMYRELAPNEAFIVEPLNYDGDSFDEARAVAKQVRPGGWEAADGFDGYVCYNGTYPFIAGGKWYSIYWYWEDVLDI